MNNYTKRQRTKEQVFKIVGFSATFFGLAVLTLLIGKTFYDAAIHSNIVDGVVQSVPRLFDTDFYTGISSEQKHKIASAGIRPALLGSIQLIVLTILMAVPLGVGAAIYLEQYGHKNRFAGFIEINISNLAGVPSIIYGILVFSLFVKIISFSPSGGTSLFAGSIALAFLVLPIIIVSSREAIKAVPTTIIDAAYGLGATKWQVIATQILPTAAGGILTGIILALSRAIGEAAPLIVVGAATILTTNPKIFGQFTALPMQIYGWASSPFKQGDANASAAIIVLLSVTFFMNGIAIYLRNRSQKNAIK